jgi:acid phosphatase
MRSLVVSLLVLFSPTCASFAAVPRVHHVYIVVEENTSYGSVIGNSAMPYLNSLANKYALATQYYANTHPSIGNYFELTTGQVLTNNDGTTSTFNVNNAVRELIGAGKTWKSYAESLPSVGYMGGDTGGYIEHHNPVVYFTDVRNSSVQRNFVVPFTHFATDRTNGALPQYSFIVPNKYHDAHNCPAGMSTCTLNQKLSAADSWLKNNIGPLVASSSFQSNGDILVVVFDEGFSTDTAHGGGHVACVVVSSKVIKGFRSTTFHQHPSTLKTMLKALGLTSYPGAASTASDLGEMFP